MSLVSSVLVDNLKYLIAFGTSCCASIFLGISGPPTNVIFSVMVVVVLLDDILSELGN